MPCSAPSDRRRSDVDHARRRLVSRMARRRSRANAPPAGTRSPKCVLLEEIPFIGVAVRHLLRARLVEEINPMHRVQLVNVTLLWRQEGVVDLIEAPVTKDRFPRLAALRVDTCVF